MSRPRVACLLTAAAALAACRGTDALSPAVAAVAGTYTLATLAGDHVPTTGNSGAIVLRADGTATYRMTYAPAGTPPSSYHVMATGTFVVRGDSVALALVTDAAHPAAVWRPVGVRQGTTLTLHYPGPADGDVAAVYQRQ
ncbi:MAG TPA: hypothetical protein VGD56_09405 [Gemmatirosa sp.]